jgi:hypothetical protein
MCNPRCHTGLTGSGVVPHRCSQCRLHLFSIADRHIKVLPIVIVSLCDRSIVQTKRSEVLVEVWETDAPEHRLELLCLVLALVLAATCALRWCGFAKRTRLVQFSRLPKLLDVAGVMLAAMGVAAARGSGADDGGQVALLASVAVAAALLWQQEVTMASGRTVAAQSLLVTLSVGAVLAAEVPEPSMTQVLQWVIACWVGWLLVTLSAPRLPLLVIATGVSVWPVSLSVLAKHLTTHSDDPGGEEEEDPGAAPHWPLWMAVPLCAAGQLLVALDGRRLSPAVCLSKK